MDKESLYEYLLQLGDNSMILGHRLSELCGHGPSLETDIALTNISLDFFGQVRNYFQYAAKVKGDEQATEDTIAFLRYDRDYRNVLLVEQPNHDFAYVIGRQFLFDAYHRPLLQHLTESKDETIAAIAVKSVKESQYHLRFSSEWVKRLGAGTEESNQKMQAAIDYLMPYAHELTLESEVEAKAKNAGIGPDLKVIKASFDRTLKDVFAQAEINMPETSWSHSGGKTGIHSEHMGMILSQLQYMQRAYPDMAW